MNVMNAKAKLLAALKVWLVIYPSITLLLFLIGSELAAVPLMLRTFILTVILVPWMIFVGVPFLESMIKLFSKKEQ